MSSPPLHSLCLKAHVWEKRSQLAGVWVPSVCGLPCTEEVLLEPRFMDPSPSCLHTEASIRSHCKELRQAVGLEAKLQSSPALCSREGRLGSTGLYFALD